MDGKCILHVLSLMAAVGFCCGMKKEEKEYLLGVGYGCIILVCGECGECVDADCKICVAGLALKGGVCPERGFAALLEVWRAVERLGPALCRECFQVTTAGFLRNATCPQLPRK